MQIEIGQFEYTECWNGVLYKKLSSYPNITDWEIQNVLDFVRYESDNGRSSNIKAEDISILKCGSILSAVHARKKSAKELKAESRNAANDPEDYFNYVMFAWGNCQAGDRLVMERKLGRFPNEEDLSSNFEPGVRFFFRYEEIVNHPKAVFDGVLPVKVKDGVVLQDWVHAIVVPAEYRDKIGTHIPEGLSEKVCFLERNGADIWKWSEIVYEQVVNQGTVP